MSYGFEVSDEDVWTVLEANALQVANSNGLSFSALAEVVHAGLTEAERAAVEKAALNGGMDLESQTEAAHEKLREVLVLNGVLKR